MKSKLRRIVMQTAAISTAAVIKNLTVEGTVTSGREYAAGLVGFSEATADGQTNTIENCTVSAAVTNPATSGNCHMGGLVAYAWSVLNIEKSRNCNVDIKGCVFDGKMLTTNGTTHCFGQTDL